MRPGTILISKEMNLTFEENENKLLTQIISLHGLEFTAIPKEKKQLLLHTYLFNGVI